MPRYKVFVDIATYVEAESAQAATREVEAAVMVLGFDWGMRDAWAEAEEEEGEWLDDEEEPLFVEDDFNT